MRSLVLLPLLVCAAMQPRFRGSTELVLLQVTVDDPERGSVLGLTNDRFTVREDLRVRPIAQVLTEPPPVSIAVALDASLSMRGPRLVAARDAVLRIYDSLGAGDELLVFGFIYGCLQCRSHLGSERLWCVR